MEYAASFASNREPSLNRTPSRTVYVHWVSEVRFQAVASFGRSSPESGSRSVSGSVMLERTTTPVEVSEDSQGSRVGGSSGSTTRSVSLPAVTDALLATVQALAASVQTTARARARPGMGTGGMGLPPP